MTLNVCSVIALVYMAITVIISAVSLKVADRKNRLNLIQNYKKGRFLIFYFSALPIYFAAYSHIGDSVVRAALKAIKFTVATAVLSFDQDVLIPIMSENTLFAVTTVIFISLAVLNTVLFSVSVFYRMLVNEAILKKIKKGKKDAVVIVGCGKKSQMIIDSMKRAGGEKSATSHKACDLLVLADNLTDEFKEYAYINRAAYIKFGDGDNLEETLKKNCASYGTRHVSVIIMTENETADLKLAFQAAALTSGIGTELNTAYTDTVCGIDVYVFSNEDNEAVYRRIIQASHGMVHCLNKYKMISVDFINNHPATLFIPNLINTKKATLKEGTDLRIQMIGFGKVNRQLFRTYTQNSAYMIDKGGKSEEYTLNYTIFDKENSHEDSTFNHTYIRYKKWLSENKDRIKTDYFDLPSEPAHVDFTQRNVNARVFYEELKAAFSYSNTGYNITVIALGSDIEALDLAEKIAVLINEEKLEKKTTVFVRIRNTALAKEAKSRFGILPQIITFGDDDSLFSYDRIVAPGAEKIAKDRHLCYSVESMKENDDEAAVKRKAIDKWLYTWSEMQRESNVFACLALRTRFHLLGYDIKASDGREKDDSDDFMKKYMSQNEIDYNGKEINGKKIVSYEGTDFHIPETPRTNLAIAEHARWNAYHICNGFVPASKEEFEKESKESLMLRRKHVNVATMKGLSEYAQFRMENEKITTNDADVLRYDYQLMDDAVWMLHRAGYMIIKVNNESEKEK